MNVEERLVKQFGRDTLTPEEWYGYKREHPQRYRVLIGHVRESNWRGYRHEGWAYDWAPPPVIPRVWFSWQQMVMFLVKHRELKDYKHISITSRPDGRISYSWDVSYKNQCDYFWSEVKDVLALLEQIDE
jgi:hypothetical protein